MAPAPVRKLVRAINTRHAPPGRRHRLRGLSVVALCLKLLVFTGMRSGEAKGLRWENVDLEGRRLHLPDTKSGKSQIVVLSPEAKTILEECREFRTEDNPFVFPGLGNGGHITDLRGCFHRSRDRAGLGGDVVIHTLRHTYALLLANSGVDGRA